MSKVIKNKTPEPTRRERAKADKRRRILDASRNLFAKFGFERTTVQQIADAADVAVGTLFLYVRDKSELLLLLFGRGAGNRFSHFAESFLEKERVL